MMMMDIFCRLGGNPICKNLQYSSDPQISYRQQLNCRYNNTVLRTIGWDYNICNNSMSPLNYHRRVCDANVRVYKDKFLVVKC